MAYCQVEEKYGSAIAKQIRKDKKELEKNRTPDEEPWYREHPEIKDNEAICYDSAFFIFMYVLQIFPTWPFDSVVILFDENSMLCEAWDQMRMWDSLVLEETKSNQQEWDYSHEAIVAEENTKALLYLDWWLSYILFFSL